MNRLTVPFALLLAFAAGPAAACGESMFSTGKGLEFQANLAPRPATVVIYRTPDPATSDAQRSELAKGLEAAGHHVVFVADTGAYAQALQAQKVDLVIADATVLGTLATVDPAHSPRLVPVIARGSKPVAGEGRFELFLRSGARLGQYLRLIDKAVAAVQP
jgi:hypothetical protein